MAINHSKRAIVSETSDEFIIEIPPKRNILIILLLTCWIVLWTFAEIGLFVSAFCFHHLETNDKLLNYLIFALFTIGGFFFFKSWLWRIAGSEVIIFSKEKLKIEKRISFLKTKIFNLNEVENFEINLPTDVYCSTGKRAYDYFRGKAPKGIFKFDYKNRRVEIANGLSENEGKSIFKMIIDNKLIK